MVQRPTQFGKPPSVAQLRAYEPSWRDRMAALMMDMGLTQNVTEGIFGSRGLGPSGQTPGMGLVDMTPLGAPLWLNEAERAKQSQSGGLGSGMLDTISAMPIPGAAVAGRGMKAAAPLTRNVTQRGISGRPLQSARIPIGTEQGIMDMAQRNIPKPPSVEGIKVYHGSPHDFDRFSMDKIGTGEGAQAYGHGLYFADREGVAKDYKRRLAKGDASMVRPDDVAASKFGGEWARLTDEIAKADASHPRGFLIPGDEGYEARQTLESARDDLHAQMVKDTAERNPHLLEGRMYEARLNASPDEFLDWDKPLSEQPESIQKTLRNAWGEDYWNQMKNKTGGDYVSYGIGAKGQERAELMDKGIKGIRYLDQGSRTGGKGTSNYVVFDDNIIEILRKYGIAGLATLGAAGAVAGSGTEAEAAQDFDPLGSGYDYQSARAAGLGRDKSNHYPSRLPLDDEEAKRLGLPPNSGLILKGRGHPTFFKTIEGEKKAGFEIIEHNGRLYSVPAGSGTEAEAASPSIFRDLKVNR